MRRICNIYMYSMAITVLFSVLSFTCPANCQEDQIEAESNKVLAILYPLKIATLSSEVSGVVKKNHLDMGEEFKKGDTLIVLDPAYCWADKKKVEATLVSATADFTTKRELYKQKSVSEIEYAEADAGVKIAKANLVIADKKLAACTIRAPYRGRVVKLLVKENELVAEGQPLIEVIDDWTIRAKFLAPSMYYEHIQIGQTAMVNVREVNMEFESKITHISPVLESNTSSFQVFAEIDNSSNILRGGMTGQIALELTEGN